MRNISIPKANTRSVFLSCLVLFSPAVLFSADSGDMKKQIESYMAAGEFEKAADTYISLKDYKSALDPAMKSKVPEKIAFVYSQLKEFEKARKYYRDAAETAVKANSWQKAADCYASMQDYDNAAIYAEKAENFEDAIRYYKKVKRTEKTKELGAKLGAKLEGSTDWEKLGNHRYSTNDYSKALEAYKKVVEKSPLISYRIAELAEKAGNIDDQAGYAAEALRNSFKTRPLTVNALEITLRTGLLKKDPSWTLHSIDSAIEATPVEDNSPWIVTLIAEREKLLSANPELKTAPLKIADCSIGEKSVMKLETMTTILEKCGETFRGAEWDKSNPPNLQAAVFFMADEIETMPANSPELMLLALQTYWEIGDKGRLLNLWDKNDYLKKWNEIKWTPKLEKAKAVFDWALNNVKPPEGSPEWLAKAVAIIGTDTKTAGGVAKLVSDLKGSPVALSQFAVEFCARNPEAETAFLTELGKQKPELDSVSAGWAFRRWKLYAGYEMVGNAASVDKSEFGRRMEQYRKYVRESHAFTGTQTIIVSGIQLPLKSRGGMDIKGILDLAEKAANGQQFELSTALLSASLMWRSCQNMNMNLGYLDSAWGAVAPNMPTEQRGILAENFGLIMLYCRMLFSWQAPDTDEVLFYLNNAPGNSKIRGTCEALCRESLASFKGNAVENSDKGSIPIVLRWLINNSSNSK